MKYRISAIILAALMSPWTYGDTSYKTQQIQGVRDVGNGGDVQVCPDDQIGRDPYTMYDIVEAKKMRGLNVNLGAPDLSVEAKIDMALNNWAKIDPFHVEMIKKWKEEAFDETTNATRFEDNIELTDIPDSNHKFITRGCKLEQLIIQDDPQFPGDPRYLGSNYYWKRMNNDNKAVTWLHEFIYRKLILNGHHDSSGARYLNALVFSQEISKLSYHDYYDVLVRSNFIDPNRSVDEFYINGELYRANNLTISKEGVVLQGHPLQDIEFTLPDGQKIIHDHEVGGAVGRSNDGGLMFLRPHVGTKIKAYGYDIEIGETDQELTHFRADGSLQKTTLGKYHRFKIQNIAPEFIGIVSFYPNGQVESGYAWFNEGERIPVAKQYQDISTNPLGRNGKVEKDGLYQVTFTAEGSLTRISHWTNKRAK